MRRGGGTFVSEHADPLVVFCYFADLFIINSLLNFLNP
jgi:hypothetical protein